MHYGGMISQKNFSISKKLYTFVEYFIDYSPEKQAK